MYVNVWIGVNMSKLIIGRHTETIFNKKNVFSGCLDIPLSNKGIDQALNMVNFISDEEIDIVFVSNLLRAKETAALLMQAYYEIKKDKYPVFMDSLTVTSTNYIPILSDKRIDERSYGILEGLSKKQVEKQYGKQKLFHWRRSWADAPKNGESLCDVYNRVLQFLNDSVFPILNNNKNILVICHQNSMRAIKIIAEQIEKDKVEQIEFENGQLIKYDYVSGELIPA